MHKDAEDGVRSDDPGSAPMRDDAISAVSLGGIDKLQFGTLDGSQAGLIPGGDRPSSVKGSLIGSPVSAASVADAAGLLSSDAFNQSSPNAGRPDGSEKGPESRAGDAI